ncbi:MAG: patatin-like phospholipase family protein [Hyphomicrobiaceae bacterium]
MTDRKTRSPRGGARGKPPAVGDPLAKALPPTVEPKLLGHRHLGSTAPFGLALGGGAARGLGHVPVLEALDDLGVRPSVIAGTSMGSIIGAGYAAGMSGREIRDYVTKLFANRAEVIRRIATRWPGSLTSLWNPLTPAMFNAETLLEILLPDVLPLEFSGLRTPFMAVATDFYAQEEVVFEEGPLFPAIAASSALPALLKPVRIGERLLIDGGFVNPTPFDILARRAPVVVAVDVTGTSARRAQQQKMPNSIDIWIGAAQITLHSIVREKLRTEAPHALLRPPVTDFGALDFFRAEEILAAAAPIREEAKRVIEALLTAGEGGASRRPGRRLPRPAEKEG